MNYYLKEGRWFPRLRTEELPTRRLSKIRLIYDDCAGFGQIFRSFSFNSPHYSPQTIKTSDSNQHILVTIANLGQALKIYWLKRPLRYTSSPSEKVLMDNAGPVSWLAADLLSGPSHPRGQWYCSRIRCRLQLRGSRGFAPRSRSSCKMNSDVLETLSC